jgi:hypothetical protein
MKRILFFTAPVLFIIFVTCTSTVIKHSPLYKFDVKPDPFYCAIILPELIDVYYPGSVESLPGSGDKKQRIVSFFRSQLREEVEKKAVFARVYDTYLLGEFAKRKVRLKAGRNEKTFHVPMPQEKIACQSVIPHVVIVLENMEFLSGKKGGAEQVKGNPDALFITLKFVMWDNNKCELVSHGYIEVSGSGSSRESWASAVADIANKIITGTPFKK